MTATIEYGDAYLAARECQDKFLLVEGPRGTGKTFGILANLLTDALEYPGIRIALVRSRRTRLTETVLNTLETLVFPAFGMAVPGGAGRENRHSYVLPNGSAFIPMGLDDPARGQSLEVAKIYVAEATEIPSHDTVASLAGALRQSVPGINRQCIVDCNPASPGHWVNKIAEPIAKGFRRVRNRADYARIMRHNRTPTPAGFWKRILTRHQDNVAYWDHVNWCYTPEGSEYIEATLSYLKGHIRRRWVDGEWSAASGTVFPEFDEDRHVVRLFAIPSHWPQYVGVDPGYDHPCAILWFAVAPNGTIYVVDELYRGGLSVAQHAKDISARNAGRTIRGYYADPQDAFKKTMQQPKSIADQFRECGLSFAPWPRSTDKQAMVESVRDLLRNNKLKVFSPCIDTINEFQSWMYKRSVTDPENPPAGDDAYEDANNHAMDVVCGVVAKQIHAAPGRVESYLPAR